MIFNILTFKQKIIINNRTKEIVNNKIIYMSGLFSYNNRVNIQSIINNNLSFSPKTNKSLRSKR